MGTPAPKPLWPRRARSDVARAWRSSPARLRRSGRCRVIPRSAGWPRELSCAKSTPLVALWDGLLIARRFSSVCSIAERGRPCGLRARRRTVVCIDGPCGRCSRSILGFRWCRALCANCCSPLAIRRCAGWRPWKDVALARAPWSSPRALSSVAASILAPTRRSPVGARANRAPPISPNNSRRSDLRSSASKRERRRVSTAGRWTTPPSNAKNLNSLISIIAGRHSTPHVALRLSSSPAGSPSPIPQPNRLSPITSMNRRCTVEPLARAARATARASKTKLSGSPTPNGISSFWNPKGSTRTSCT